MEFNIGDVVRIKSREELSRIFKEDGYGVYYQGIYSIPVVAKLGTNTPFKYKMYRNTTTDFEIVTKEVRGFIGRYFVYGISQLNKKHVYADKYLGDWLTPVKPKTHRIEIYD